MSFTQARNRRGPNTFPCGTTDVSLTSSEKCPTTLTLSVQPYRNSLIHITTLESTPEFAIFVSSRSWGTKSKAFEKSIIITSILSPLSRESAMSWHTVITWLLHEYPGLKLCWLSYNQTFLSHTCLRHEAIRCSICLQTTEVKLTGLKFVTNDQTYCPL